MQTIKVPDYGAMMKPDFPTFSAIPINTIDVYNSVHDFMEVTMKPFRRLAIAITQHSDAFTSMKIPDSLMHSIRRSKAINGYPKFLKDIQENSQSLINTQQNIINNILPHMPKLFSSSLVIDDPADSLEEMESDPNTENWKAIISSSADEYFINFPENPETHRKRHDLLKNHLFSIKANFANFLGEHPFKTIGKGTLKIIRDIIAVLGAFEVIVDSPEKILTFWLWINHLIR